MTNFILDPSCKAPHDKEFLLVDDDLTLLRGVLAHQPLFVCGERLCRWASQIAEARGLSQVWRKAPAQELLEECPGISLSEAESIIGRIGAQIDDLPRPLFIDDVVRMMWPNEILFHTEPSVQHAFAWLVWCIGKSLTSEEIALLCVVVEKWMVNSSVDLRRAYHVMTSDDALEIVKAWLGIKKDTFDWPAINLELPKVLLGRLVNDWKKQLVKTEGAFFQDLVDLNPNREILFQAARVTSGYFQTNPTFLNQSRVAALKPYLSIDESDKLYILLPPEDPGTSPENFHDVIDWFKTAYLPYRLRAPKEKAGRVREIARDFAVKFLDFYAKSHAGGEGAEVLSWCKTAHLDKSSDGITLLVVLDGLGIRDGEYFVDQFQDKSQRLELDVFDIVVSPLPTVTCFAKPALLTGFHPACALEEDRVGIVERRAPEVVKALNDAVPGDVVIWSILEPDHTYHQSIDSKSIRTEVDGWLHGFSTRLVDIVQQVDASKKLRVIITTDHGRLLSSSQRLHQVPQGMEAHGRAAWGTSDIHFDEKGYFIDGDLVYLHPERFGVPQVCALLLNDESFVMSDGRGGKEAFPHGGIYPEEVFIPWIQFSRDRGTVSIDASLSGKGVAKSNGTYVLEILNTSAIQIQVLELEIQKIGYKTRLTLDVAPMGMKGQSIPVPSWPTTSEAISLEATIIYSLPNGERKSLLIKPSLVVEEMYQQIDILGEL